MAKAKILIILGSDSDLPIMEDGLNFLKTIGVPFILIYLRAPPSGEDRGTCTESQGGRHRSDHRGCRTRRHLPGVIASIRRCR